MTTAIILAGGQSTRLGTDKASLVLDGHSLLQRVLARVSPLVDDSIVVCRAGQELPEAEAVFRRAEDVHPGSGPLGGFYSGLLAAQSFPALALACDMPLLQPALLEELLQRAESCDAVVPLHGGLPEPLCAAYGAACLEPVRVRLERNELKLAGFLADVDTCYLQEEEWRQSDPAGFSFVNINTEEDLVRTANHLQPGIEATY